MQREYQLIYIFVMQEMGYSNPTAVYSNTLKKIQTKKNQLVHWSNIYRPFKCTAAQLTQLRSKEVTADR